MKKNLPGLSVAVILFAFTLGLPALGQDNVREVNVGDLTLSVPATWEQQRPSNSLRLGQFLVPASEGDAEGAELSIFNFGGGPAANQQIERWKGQFDPQGRKFQAFQGQSPAGQYVLVDLSGTYKKSVGPPILGRTQPVPNSRMLVAMLAVEGKGQYFLKLVGPQKTVSSQLAAFRGAFGADAKQEKPFGQ